MNIQRSFVMLLAVACVLSCSVQAQQEPDPSTAKVRPTAERRPYLLGPGDMIEVKVFGATDINLNVQVDGDGYVSSLPFIDPVLARCRSEREIRSDITTAYRRLIKDPQVSVRLVERNSRQPASVFGAVRQSRQVPMLKQMRLNELIAASGGFSDKAAGTIQILHTEPLLCPEPGDEAEGLPLDPATIPFQVVKIAELIKGSSNPVIRPGDLVLVTEAEPVYITGSVMSPGGILLRDRLTLSRALGMVGGTRKEAKLSEIRIYRQKPGTNDQEIIKVDYAAIKRNQSPDIFLQPYDVIDVSENGIFSGRAWLELVVGGLTGGLRSSLSRPIP